MINAISAIAGPSRPAAIIGQDALRVPGFDPRRDCAHREPARLNRHAGLAPLHRSRAAIE